MTDLRKSFTVTCYTCTKSIVHRWTVGWHSSEDQRRTRNRSICKRRVQYISIVFTKTEPRQTNQRKWNNSKPNRMTKKKTKQMNTANHYTVDNGTDTTQKKKLGNQQHIYQEVRFSHMQSPKNSNTKQHRRRGLRIKKPRQKNEDELQNQVFYSRKQLNDQNNAHWKPFQYYFDSYPHHPKVLQSYSTVHYQYRFHFLDELSKGKEKQ